MDFVTFRYAEFFTARVDVGWKIADVWRGPTRDAKRCLAATQGRRVDAQLHRPIDSSASQRPHGRDAVYNRRHTQIPRAARVSSNDILDGSTSCAVLS